MVEEPSLDPRELLTELSKSFCSISSALSCVSKAIAQLERENGYYNFNLEFDEHGVLLEKRSCLSSERFIPADDYGIEEDYWIEGVKDTCEWLPKWVDKLWEEHQRAVEALRALPDGVIQLLSDHVGNLWRPMVCQECLNILLVWPGEVLHTRAAKKVCRRVPDLLKLASEHPPYDKWKYFRKRLDVYRSHILAVCGDVAPLKDNGGEAGSQKRSTQKGEAEPKKIPGPKVTPAEQKNRKLVADRWDQFKNDYRQFNFSNATYRNAAEWMIDKFEDMPFLTEGLSDPTDYDQIGNMIKQMVRAYKETPGPGLTS